MIVYIERFVAKFPLFPIRGKIINAFKASRQQFFNNEEVQGITRIVFGQDYKKGLTVDDAKVEKIIFMSDADVDEPVV